MKRRVLILDIGLFEPRCGSLAGSERRVLALLEIVIDANLEVLACGRVPPLYQAGVRYLPEPADKEVFMSIPAVIAHGGADCEDLSAWRVAELRAIGERADPMLTKFMKNGMPSYHVRVMRQDGRIEDPSRVLGMGVKNYRAPKRVEVRNATSTIPLGSAYRGAP